MNINHFHMKKLLLLVPIILLCASCDNGSSNYEVETNALIQTCKDKGGVPNIELGGSLHYDSYRGCDFPLPTK